MPVVADPTARSDAGSAGTIVDMTKETVEANDSTSALVTKSPSVVEGTSNSKATSVSADSMGDDAMLSTGAKPASGTSTVVSPESVSHQKSNGASKRSGISGSDGDGLSESPAAKKKAKASSKLPFLETLDFTNAANISTSYRSVKGDNAPRQPSLPDTIAATLNAYPVLALKTFAASNKIEYKGNKGPAIEHIVQQLMKRVEYPPPPPGQQESAGTPATITMVVSPPADDSGKTPGVDYE